MKTTVIFLTFLLSTNGVAFAASAARATSAKGFICYFETEKTKRTIEIAGFSEDANSIPKRYDNLIWAGQVASLDKATAAPGPIYDLDSFQVGASGFAGQIVKVEATGETQSLTIKFATGASNGPNGHLIVSKGQKVVTEGPVQCKLLR